MNRTRLIFFAILAVCAVILLVSLIGQVQSQTLFQMYVAATVFGVGVVAMDFLGLLGQHGDAAGHDFGTFGDHGAGAHDFGGHELSGATDGHGLAEAGNNGHLDGSTDFAGPAGGHAAETAGHDHAGEMAAAHGEKAPVTHETGARPSPGQSPGPILSVLAYLRLLVYFCLGFGPIGLLALLAGRGVAGSLLFAVPGGIASLLLARTFFRFQRSDTGAVRPEGELLGERASVIVPLDHFTMGKVRVHAGMNVLDVYAVAADEGETFERGSEVRIVRVTDECVHVR